MHRNRSSWKVPAGLALAVAVVAPALGLVGAATGESTSLKVGTSLGSVDALSNLGAKPDYGTFWVGIWTKKDWDSVDNQLRNARAKGVTPFIQWYYWGDDITPTCVEKGCYSTLHGGWKTKSDWNAMAVTLAKRIRSVMGNAPVVVNLETEFNKQGIQSFEAFDGYLAAQASTFRTHAPNAKLVLGFGNWGWQYYKNFDRAIAKVDYLGFQELLGSTRDSDYAYDRGVDRILAAAKNLHDTFRKPTFLTDTGFSSYPEPKYSDYQERMVKGLFARLDELAAAGVHAWMYRAMHDNPTFNTANYYGYAERYWGFIRKDGSWKPAMDDYVRGVKALRAGPDARAVPATLEAETLRERTTGGVAFDADATGDRAFNLWGNGHVGDRIASSTSGAHAIEVRARGTPAAGGWPVLALSVGGAEIARWSVSSSSYRTYTASVWLGADSEKALAIGFVNDLRTATEDRNLLVDTVRVARGAGSAVEAEAMDAQSVGGKVLEAAASGGAAWNLWSNGNVRDTIAITSAGAHEITVRARGTPAAGVAPIMVVYVDGKEIGRASVAQRYVTYSFDAPWLAAWNHGVQVAFVNDHRTASEDRNLVVDRVTWAPR